MVLLSFGFTNIQVSKGKSTGVKVNIKSGMNITDVGISKVIQQGEQKPFSIKFTYKVEYLPAAGHITLDGELIYLAPQKVADEIQASWKKDKSLPKNIALQVYNRILHNCTVESLLLSREVGLPAPLQLPKLRNPVESTKAPVKKAAVKKTATKTGSTKKTSTKK